MRKSISLCLSCDWSGARKDPGFRPCPKCGGLVGSVQQHMEAYWTHRCGQAVGRPWVEAVLHRKVDCYDCQQKNRPAPPSVLRHIIVSTGQVRTFSIPHQRRRA